MSFNFVKPVISINGKGGEGQFTFYKQGFVTNELIYTHHDGVILWIKTKQEK